MKTLEEGVKKINKQQSEFYSRIFKLEDELHQYEADEEKKYRDVVRKVLDMDNKFARKFNLLGENIIELSKEKKGS